MSRIALATALLVAAALAGCAAGDGEGQLPTDLEGEGSTTGPTPDSTNTTRDEGNATEDNRTVTLTVSPGGPAPLNVTIQYDAQGADANESANLTWTLVMWRSGDAEGGNATSGNATAGSNGTAGNGTGNGTAGNGTTESGSTTTGPGNGTAGGNATSTTSTTTGPGPGTAGGNSTAGNGTAGNGTSQGPPQPGNGTANRTASNFTLEVNGTAADLPGHTEQRLNVTGRYEVVFAVDFGNGTWFHRNATIDVGPMEPGTPLGNETAQFTGTFLASEPALCMGSEEFTWVLNATKDGIPAEVDFVAATVDADGVSDFVLTLVAPNGTEVASGPSINETGTFEAGNYTLRAESCVAVDTAYTVTALARYVAARAGGVAG